MEGSTIDYNGSGYCRSGWNIRRRVGWRKFDRPLCRERSLSASCDITPRASRTHKVVASPPVYIHDVLKGIQTPRWINSKRAWRQTAVRHVSLTRSGLELVGPS
jgi:hypothetical protein